MKIKLKKFFFFSNNGELASKKNQIDVVTNAVNMLKDIADKTNLPQMVTDEFEAFGKIVVAHLRQLPINTALASQSDLLNYLVQKR